MSLGPTIRVLPAEEIAARAGGEIDFLAWPDRGTVFAVRAMRLRQLARGHAMGDFLGFVAELSLAQQAALDAFPEVPLPDDAAIDRARLRQAPPLPAADWSRAPAWRDALRSIATAVRMAGGEPARRVVDDLLAADAAVLESQADALLDGTSAGLDLASAPLVGAALQVYWTHLALALSTRTAGAGRAIGRIADETRCPACGSAPVASLTRSSGESLGQRFLQCSLCSLQWHLLRSKCPHCLASDGLAFQSLDPADLPEGESRAAQAAVQAESCDRCGHYLKIVHADRDPHVDAVADDLASVTLDLLVAQTGLKRHGVNLMLLFGDGPPDEPPDPG
ncbi:MAG: formate dehydrogenase accessory protein FdhE [Burkholderiaceae bacterium]